MPLPDGSIAQVKIDFDTLRRLSTVARDEYGLAGCVQHGASTLPEEAFHHFPANGTAEIHLATGFQNILYDGGGLPADLRAEMMAWCVANCADERKDGETRGAVPLQDPQEGDRAVQAPALGRSLPPTRRRSAATCARSSGSSSTQLQIAGTRALVERFVTPVALPRPLPAALGGGAAAGVTAGASVFEDDGSGE